MRTGFCAFTLLVRLIQSRMPRITLLVRQWTTTLLVRLLQLRARKHREGADAGHECQKPREESEKHEVQDPEDS